jgi:hypothetical protein
VVVARQYNRNVLVVSDKVDRSAEECDANQRRDHDADDPED